MKVEKVWNDSKFLSLSSDGKLTYLYLVTHPAQTELGVLQLNPKLVSAQLDFTMSDFRKMTTLLIEADMITVMSVNKDIYFIINDYYQKSAKTHSSITRLKSKMEAFPEAIQEYLKGKLNIHLEVKEFVPPTKEDVEKYAKEKGYNVNGTTFIEYYTSMADTLGRTGFYDKNGKRVVDWRAKLRKVWFRDDNKLKQIDGSPKGFEHFHIIHNKVTFYPTAWTDGLPVHTDFSVTKLLQSKYEEESKGSGKVSQTETKPNTRRQRQSTANR